MAELGKLENVNIYTYFTLPGHRDKQLLQNSLEEIGQELNVNWAVAKEKWRSVWDRFVEAPSSGCTALLNIHATDKEVCGRDTLFKMDVSIFLQKGA